MVQESEGGMRSGCYNLRPHTGRADADWAMIEDGCDEWRAVTDGFQRLIEAHPQDDAVTVFDGVPPLPPSPSHVQCRQQAPPSAAAERPCRALVPVACLTGCAPMQVPQPLSQHSLRGWQLEVDRKSLRLTCA